MQNKSKVSNILIAVDDFKGSLSSKEICHILQNALTDIDPQLNINSCPLADGGDGSVEIISDHLKLVEVTCNAMDPLGRSINTTYYRNHDTAYIELASASGLVLLKASERDPMRTSSFGTGLQIKDALNKGLEKFCLFLGGSATNDGGIGIAAALGYRFMDDNDNELESVGASLNSISKILPPDKLPNIKELTLCCDVDNPAYGTQGAAYVYARQKGAGPDQVKYLDSGLKNLCEIIRTEYGIDLSVLKGGGAAGAIALSMCGLFGAKIISGMSLISEITQLESKISKADLVISGEGSVDSQTLNGKLIYGVSKLCKKHGKKLCLVVGKNELDMKARTELNIDHIFSIMDKAEDLKDAISNSKMYLKKIARDLTIWYQLR